MKLEQMAFVARPRHPWEAVDLGLRMARSWWRPLFLSWLTVALPCLVLFWLLPIPSYWIPWLIWWLKPLFERPLLYILSRAVFGDTPTVRETLRQLPRLLQAQWFSALLWRRFSPSRSYDLPIVLLEDLAGKARKQRLSLLHRDQYSPAFWLTLIGAHLEVVMALSLVVLVAALMPGDDMGEWFDRIFLYDQVAHLLYLLAMALTAPFYVAAGFALYLNRRVHLEGWDIELVFKRLAHRTRSHAGTVNAWVVAVLMFGYVLHPAPVMAQTNDALVNPYGVFEGASSDVWVQGQNLRADSPESIRQAIERIVHSEELEERRVTRYPRFLQDWDFSETEGRRSALPLWLMDAVRVIAQGVEWLAWVLVLGLVVLVILRYRSWLEQVKKMRSAKSPVEELPETLFGLDLRSSALPEHVTQEVERLWAEHKPRAAIGLLYRATLNRLMLAHQMHFQSGFTETDCLRQVELKGDTVLVNFMTDLTSLWQRVAYAHQMPAEREVTQLCASWNEMFASGCTYP